MATIEINGKKIEAEPGSMIIEVADKVGFQIPRFCYHKKLSIAANCRMCLVDVEKAPKALPACATPVTDGMKVWTHSPKALMAQKAVMEFLLINHPLDCPICDQGGECELQDVAMGYGDPTSEYKEGKRSVLDKNIGPLIATDMTRCIQCTRCVRFGTEVAGIRELGATGRGEHLEITTFIEKNVESEVSGNIIDLCPVGALTSKPYRFTARGWELTQKSSIAPHDCLGSNIFVHSRRAEVMRVVPKDNESLNETWLSDRDRFSYVALKHEERLLHPKIKKNDVWQTVSWAEALEYAANTIQNTATVNSKQLGALMSPNATIEEAYLMQKLLRNLKCNNIDHRLRQTDFDYETAIPLCPTIGVDVKSIEHFSSIVLIGSDIRKENPLLALKVRKATLNHGKVMVINPYEVENNFSVSVTNIVPQGDLVLGIAALVKAVLENKMQESQGKSGEKAADKSFTEKYQCYLALLKDVKVDQVSELIRDQFLIRNNNSNNNSNNNLILLGALSEQHPYFSDILFLSSILSEITNAKMGWITEGANTAGCWLAGAIPHRVAGGASIETSGLNAKQMIDKPLKNYLLWNIDPDLDCADGRKALKTLNEAEQVIAFTTFESQNLRNVANIMLPIAPFTENEGHFCNGEGNWQAFEAAVPPKGDARPGWKILRVLGNVLGMKDFEYETRHQVREDLAMDIANAQHIQYSQNSKDAQNIKLNKTIESKMPEQLHFISGLDMYLKIAPVPLYASDNLVRRSEPLQKMRDAGIAAIQLNSKMVNQLQLDLNKMDKAEITYQDTSVTLPVIVNDNIPDQVVLIPMALKETLALGGSYVQVGIKAC